MDQVFEALDNEKTDEELSRDFAFAILSQFGHEREFDFDLMSFQYEPVKHTMELGGFSVHRTNGSVAVIRDEPDLAPVAWHTPKLSPEQISKCAVVVMHEQVPHTAA